MKAMTLRRRDNGKLLFHFTLDHIELPEEPFYWPRVWGGKAETEGVAIVEWILSRPVGAIDNGQALKFEDGDAYVEGLAMSFVGDTLYCAELVDSPERVNGADPPVETAEYLPPVSDTFPEHEHPW